MKHGKKYLDSKKSFDTLKLFDVREGLETVLSTAKAKFDETIELSVRLGVDPRHAETLFLNNKGRGLTRVMIYHIIREAARAAGITKHISPHTLRHSFATHLLEGGASIRQVQQMLGHESIVTTEIYTHLDGESLGRNVDLHHPLSDR